MCTTRILDLLDSHPCCLLAIPLATQLKFDGAAAQQDEEVATGGVQPLAPFVCEYFFQKYGVKRLVQRRLRELLASVNKHKADPRVQFFARACGLWDPPSAETMDYFMSVR